MNEECLEGREVQGSERKGKKKDLRNEKWKRMREERVTGRVTGNYLASPLRMAIACSTIHLLASLLTADPVTASITLE